MKQLYPEASLGLICGLFGKSRHAHYKRQKSEARQVMQDAIVIKRVTELRADMPRLGTRKLYYLLSGLLEQHEIRMGRDRLFDLLSDYGMLVRRRKRRKVYTTNSNHPFRKYANLIRDFTPNRANQLWVSDITYISLMDEGFGYLSLITDAYSRKIIGYCFYPTLQKEGPIEALEMALDTYDQAATDLIHHSDRGLQYCCKDYISLLEGADIAISMTEKSDPYENAIAERVNGILKTEFYLDKPFNNFEQASDAIDRAIRVYNELRPHASCNYLTPAQAHESTGVLLQRWKKRNHAAPYTNT